MKTHKLVILLYVILLIFQINPSNEVLADNFDDGEKLESFVKEQMNKGKIPGLSIVVVNGNESVYKKGFGYADLEDEKPVTEETLFEIGSNSKAFTALAIYKLVEEGKIGLNSNVNEYIPWFKMAFHNGDKKVNADITIEQLLHHTSGIPFHTIKNIPESGSDTALEDTVKGVMKQELNAFPGEEFEYASINYDILGLVIQKVTGLSYEQYMDENVLAPLDLNNTFLFSNETSSSMAKGYKLAFLKPMEYKAPIFRGNTPAGYFISNANDMEQWLRLQMGEHEAGSAFNEAVRDSHIPNRSVPPSSDGSSYSGGWEVYQIGSGEVSHSGSNPNYSSFVIFRPEDKIGVAVMANLNTAITEDIGRGVLDMILNREVMANSKDMYKSIDAFSFTLIIFMIPFICITLFLISRTIIQLIRGQRVLQKSKAKRYAVPLINILVAAVLAYGIYNVPSVFLTNIDWGFVKVWAPITMLIAAWTVLTAIVLFCLYLSLIYVFPMENNNKNLFPLFILSVTSGFGNAMIIFIINEALNRSNNSNLDLFLYFFIGILVYVSAQKLVRTQLITLTNNLIYQKRVTLLNRILNTPYENMERMNTEKIQTTLNNDTEAISNHAPTIITGLTDSITLICCLVYLGVINIYGLLISIGVILLAAGMYYIAGRSANNLWERTRNIQNIFFRYINDLIGGYKELSIGEKKRNEFEDDMKESCEEYKEKRIKGGLKFANVFIIGELLFVLVIGAVTFLFPLMFKHIQSEFLQSYVFVFLYMTGPINSILHAIPNAIQMQISWKRINEFQTNLSSMEREYPNTPFGVDNTNRINIKVSEVGYQYDKKNRDSFHVGPFNCEFKSNEITFITGGNGSGKSTFAKLLTGLYVPDQGKILVNDKEIGSDELGELYSAIFSDYYLFKKVYGVDCSKKRQKIEKYLKKLRMDQKVSIENGTLSTTKLSTGQRKRLALLISYLDEKPIYLFDEWAADQDPEFRHLFYMEILPELKEEGKCIIAITHDDRYFYVADQIIKMERGQVIELTDNSRSEAFYNQKEELANG